MTSLGHWRLSDNFHYLVQVLDFYETSSKYIVLVSSPPPSSVFSHVELILQPDSILTQFPVQSSYSINEDTLCSQGQKTNLNQLMQKERGACLFLSDVTEKDRS